MPNLTPFFYEQQTVRSLLLDGAPWFVAKDVCDILGYENPTKALADHLDADEKSTQRIFVPQETYRNESLGQVGQHRNVNIISESGLYALILRSHKPQARAFRRWITGEVLPAIRRAGHYRAPAPRPPRDVQAMLDGLFPPEMFKTKAEWEAEYAKNPPRVDDDAAPMIAGKLKLATPEEV